MNSFAYGPRKKARKVLVGWLIGAMLVGTGAFAAWFRFSQGTVTISTTSPESGTIVIIEPVSFSDPGTSKVTHFDSTLPGSVADSYTQYTVEATSVLVGPCAGFITIAAGQAGSWQLSGSPNPLSGGATRRTQSVAIDLAANAPQACSDQASIALPVKLKLVP